MSSRVAVLLGAQRPRVANTPKAHFSHADDAAFLASSYGLVPDDWQQLVIEAWLGEDRRGQWAAGRCGLAVPRQNGKNGVVEIVELYKTVALGRKILHTAHEVKTARKAFVRLAGFFENEPKWPELAAMVQEIRKTNGQEAIVLTNGGSVEFVARSRGSGRGYTVDDLVLDEAQELTDEQLEALLPTISSAPSGNPQIVMLGTPPGPGSPGEVFARTREAGVGGKDRRLSWHEWSIEKVIRTKEEAADRALWAATNPSLGRRLNSSVIEDEWAQMSVDGFARERLGVWPSASTEPPVVPAATWAALATATPPTVGRVSYGVKFSVDGALVALGVARRPDEGPVHVEVVEHRSMASGTTWLAEWLAARWRDAAAIVVDGKSGAGALVNALRAAGVPAKVIVAPTTDQVISAHAMFLEAVTGAGLTHFAQPALDDSVGGAGKRSIGKAGGWGWAPITPDGDVTPVECVTLAHFGAMTSKRRPGRKTKAVVM